MSPSTAFLRYAIIFLSICPISWANPQIAGDKPDHLETVLPAGETQTLWPPLDAETIARRTPKLDPQADAECLLAQTILEDRKQGRTGERRITYLLRAKLYTSRAMQVHGNVELLASTAERAALEGIAARTILPDGRIIELPAASLLSTVALKSRYEEVRAVRFAFPSLTPGAIIEYRYTRVLKGKPPVATRLVWQKEMPVWETQLFLKGRRDRSWPMELRAYPFQSEQPEWRKTADGFQTMRLTNLPGFKEEPYAPASDQLRAWMLLQYEDPAKDWQIHAKREAKAFHKYSRPDEFVTTKALALTGHHATYEAKLEALADFCRKEIRNLGYSSEDFAEQKQPKLKAKQMPHRTLQLRAGTMRDINFLFAAMARSIGFPTRLVRSSSATAAPYRFGMPGDALLPNALIAVGLESEGRQSPAKPKQQWRFYNPGIPYLPSGQVDWDEEGQIAILCHPEGPEAMQLPYSAYTQNSIRRVANVQLQPNGNLQGQATEEYSGQYANSQKRYYENLSPEMRSQELRQVLAERFEKANIDELKLESAATAMGNIKLGYQLRKPNFAQATNTRLYVPLSLFEFASSPMFSAQERLHPVQFRNAYLEYDEIHLQLPERYAPEELPAAVTLRFGASSQYTLECEHLPEKNEVVVRRTLRWQHLHTPASGYAQLKEFWTQVAKADHDQFSLRLTARPAKPATQSRGVGTAPQAPQAVAGKNRRSPRPTLLWE